MRKAKRKAKRKERGKIDMLEKGMYDKIELS